MKSSEEYGPLQHEVHYSPPASNNRSLDHIVGCDNDHAKHVPVQNFKLANLPEDIRSDEVFRLIKHNIDLTVMVHVKGYETSGKVQKCDRQGSGSICYFSDTHDIYPCSHGDVDKCQICHIPNCPYLDILGKDHFLLSNHVSSVTEAQLEKAHLAFRVSTNQHVVNDEEDAKNTTVHLFYNNEDQKDMVTAKVACICEQWEEQDKVHLVCVMDMNAQVKHLLESMRNDFRQTFASLSCEIRNKFINNYVAVVSHPHGHPKVISIGRKLKCEHKKHTNNKWYMETKYQVETCIGCSGAPVIGPGWVDGGPVYRVHCGFVTSRQNQKVCVSKSHWVVDSDPRGGNIIPQSEEHKDK